ncbi:MAG: 4-hydroxyacetophenone monooxygenase [Terriglobia bacterium]|nr:MAG: 4-hydroxyacetophenone monooxygenase [Terriglobia bacterium]
MLPQTHVDVLIVGAGFAGLGMAIELRKAGWESFLVIEKGDDVGGTWRENRYPGCACDIPSHLYSFSFDLNAGWTRMYAPQPEIWDYLRRCAKRYGVLGNILFSTPLRDAVWEEAQGAWQVTVGEGMRITARVLISGMGALHVPQYPDLPGMERFAGPSFHSAAWDAQAVLDGKDVAVIGTGASAVQITPQIASRTQRLYHFQRTPAWIIPKADFAIPKRWRRRFERVPLLMRAFRTLLFWNLEMRVGGFLGNRRLNRLGTKLALRHLETQVRDPELRGHLTPSYQFGCKRVLISSDFYPALQRPNVELVTQPITEVRERSIVTADGRERPLDAIIYATGFQATRLLDSAAIYGRGGISFGEGWQKRKAALWGITKYGFPNLFLLLGPNTGLGHNSVVLMIEAQIRYVMSCLALMRRQQQQVMELREEAEERFEEFLRKRMPGSVWQAGGCRSWYQDPETGENVALWPGSVREYQRRTRRVSARDYELRDGPRVN